MKALAPVVKGHCADLLWCAEGLNVQTAQLIAFHQGLGLRHRFSLSHFLYVFASKGRIGYINGQDVLRRLVTLQSINLLLLRLFCIYIVELNPPSRIAVHYCFQKYPIFSIIVRLFTTKIKDYEKEIGFCHCGAGNHACSWVWQRCPQTWKCKIVVILSGLKMSAFPCSASVVRRHGIPAPVHPSLWILDSCAICLSLTSLHKIALQSSAHSLCPFSRSPSTIPLDCRPLCGMIENLALIVFWNY